MNINSTILGQLISFFIFLFFCAKYIWIPLISVINKRQEKILEKLNFIKSSEKKIELKNKEADFYIEEAKLKAKKIIEQANRKSLKIIELAKFEAKKQSKIIKKKAILEIEIDRKKAQREIYAKITQLTLLATEKIIGDKISSKLDQDLIEKSLTNLSFIKELNK